MRILIIGLSSIVQRRVLPALQKIDAIDVVDIASRSKTAPAAMEKVRTFFNDYSVALSASDADLVYVSLPNSEHLAWVRASLVAGKHVIVDKPAVLTLAEAEACLDLAASKSLLLAEATVFGHHSQFSAIKAFLEANGPLTHVDAHFIIPPLPAHNFRSSRSLGGGCLLDMGPYAAAVSRIFGASLPPVMTAYSAPPSAEFDIDVGFSLLARFNNGARYTGHFSFEGEYQNRLDLIGARGSLSVERVFSPPPDYGCVWHVRRANKVTEVPHMAEDVFGNFLAKTVAAVTTGAHGSFADDMLLDAKFRAALAASLNHGNVA